MKTIIVLGLTMLFLSGCLVRTHRSSSYRSSSKVAKKCAPSHHWNGRNCEHNGRGSGARKHDY